MILAETSIIIDAIRPSLQTIRFRLIMEEAAICGVVKAELLHGVRTPKERLALLKACSLFPTLETTDRVWETTGDLLALLRTAGKPVPFADVVQAAVALEYDIPIWTKDSQFKLIQTVEPKLKLFVP